MTRKIFFARDWYGTGKNWYEIYSTVCMGYTFTVGKGIERDPNFSIFYVTNDGIRDHYQILDVYITGNDTLEQIQKGVLATLQKEMKGIITHNLLMRFKSGIITIEQIKNLQTN